MAGPEPLSPEDTTLLCATTPEAQLQIGALCRFDGAPLRDAIGQLRLDDVRDHVASRLHLIPRFRQRVQSVPFDLARPVWVDDTGFDLARHIRSAVLPEPGGAAELRRFVGEVLGGPLDPAHPLWDLWLIDGLDNGDVAVVLRTHHLVADGLSLLRAAIALLDFEADPPPDPPPVPWRPVRAPHPGVLAVAALATRRRHQLELAAGAAWALLDPRRALRMTRSTVTAVTSPPRPAPRLAVTGRVGTRRDFLWASLPLEPLRTVAHAQGATLNDVVLAAVTGALRSVLGPEAVKSLAGNPPKVLVPVGNTPGGDGGNLFSFVVTGLPVHLEDPGQVLERVHHDMGELKASGQSTEMAWLFSVVDVVPVPLLRGLATAILARQPFVNLAVTNLPGSEAPLYLLGSHLRELQPIITGVGNIACIVGVLSYCDHLGVSITVDPDVIANPDDLLAALVAASKALILSRVP